MLHEYPFTNFNEVNLDWLIWRLKKLEARMDVLEAKFAELVVVVEELKAEFEIVKELVNELKELVEELEEKIGNLDDLQTEDKSSIVAAINELVGKFNTVENKIKVIEKSIDDLKARVETLESSVGQLNLLKTTVKTDLVSAINELFDGLKELNEKITNLDDYVDWESNGYLGAKNLLDFPYPLLTDNLTQNGITFTYNDDNSITLNGTSTTTFNKNFQGRYENQGKAYPVGKYLVSLYISSGQIHWFCDYTNTLNTSVTLCSGNNSEYEIALVEDYFHQGKGMSYLGFGFNIPEGTTFNNVVLKPMLRLVKDNDDTWREPSMTNIELSRAYRELDNTIGKLADLTTTDKSSIVKAMNTLVSSVGQLSNLETPIKSNIVMAINSVLNYEIPGTAWDVFTVANYTSQEAGYLFNNIAGYIQARSLGQVAGIFIKGYYASADSNSVFKWVLPIVRNDGSVQNGSRQTYNGYLYKPAYGANLLTASRRIRFEYTLEFPGTGGVRLTNFSLYVDDCYDDTGTKRPSLLTIMSAGLSLKGISTYTPQ